MSSAFSMTGPRWNEWHIMHPTPLRILRKEMTSTPFARGYLSVSYRCHPDLAWSVENNTTILIRRDTGATSTLGYPEAALWDFLSRGIPLQRIVPLIAAIAGMEKSSAHAWMAGAIDEWTAAGWLIEAEQDG
jgi:hypothetical protein